jgi:hypothetical protein
MICMFTTWLTIPAAVLVFATGFGCRISTLALATSWVHESLRGRFFGAIQIFENIGLLIADPILQNVFAASLKLNPAWLPLTFFVASVSRGLFTPQDIVPNSHSGHLSDRHIMLFTHQIRRKYTQS